VDVSSGTILWDLDLAALPSGIKALTFTGNSVIAVGYASTDDEYMIHIRDPLTFTPDGTEQVGFKIADETTQYSQNYQADAILPYATNPNYFAVMTKKTMRLVCLEYERENSVTYIYDGLGADPTLMLSAKMLQTQDQLVCIFLEFNDQTFTSRMKLTLY
jgi:hypothetical protein